MSSLSLRIQNIQSEMVGVKALHGPPGDPKPYTLNPNLLSLQVLEGP